MQTPRKALVAIVCSCAVAASSATFAPSGPRSGKAPKRPRGESTQSRPTSNRGRLRSFRRAEEIGVDPEEIVLSESTDAVARRAEVTPGASVRPTAPAAADFDEDGVPDLVSGFTEADGGGFLTVRCGDIASLFSTSCRIASSADWMSAASSGTTLSVSGSPAESSDPFIAGTHELAVSPAPDFPAAGDFDADGHQDLVCAALDGEEFEVPPGDGHGGFGEPRRVALHGRGFAAPGFSRSRSISRDTAIRCGARLLSRGAIRRALGFRSTP
jgi:hypothetical protein